MQDEQHANIQKVLEKQQESDKEFREQLMLATEKLKSENDELRSRCQQQESLLQQQHQQFKECSDAVQQAQKVLSSSLPLV